MSTSFAPASSASVAQGHESDLTIAKIGSLSCPNMRVVASAVDDVRALMPNSAIIRTWHAPAQLRKDRRRLNGLISAGWTVLHVTDDRLRHDLDGIVAEIRAVL